MRTMREVVALRSQVHALSAILEKLPASAVIERFGTERRIAGLQAELLEIEAGGEALRQLAEVALAFDGEPVRGSSGIDAEFAGAGIAEYQKLLSLVAASRSREVLRGYGRIPDEQYCRLQITGTVEGSFGFLLEEDPRVEPVFGESHVAEAVESLSEVLAATAADDERFAETISGLDARVRNQLAHFLKLVASNKASLKVTSPARRVVFRTADDVQEALDRVNDATVSESDAWHDGTLQGYLPIGRRFEFKAESGDFFTGPLATQLDSSKVKPFQDRDCRARIKSVTVFTRGSTRLRHILLDVAEVEGPDGTDEGTPEPGGGERSDAE